METLTLLFSAVAGLVMLPMFLLYRHLNQNNHKLYGLGVPMAPNLPFKLHEFNSREMFLGYLKKYGKVWGQFNGINAHLYVADPEILKEVMVKKFDAFADRQHFPVHPRYVSLIDSRTDTWKGVRKALSPTFTSGKLKSMFVPMGDVADEMVSHLEKMVGDGDSAVVDMKKIFQGLSLDSISNCAFGIRTNSFENPENELFQICVKNFTNVRFHNMSQSLRFKLISYFPQVIRYYANKALKKKEDDYDTTSGFLWKTTKDIAESRSSPGRGDFVDRLNELRKEGALTDAQAFAQGIAFFQAGFETSSNTLSTLTYNLATNPEAQERIFREVESVLAKQGSDVVDHDTVSSMHYMEAAIQENLRMYPPVTRINRHCLKDITLDGGRLHVKEGTLVQIPIWAIQHDPDLYPDPDRFEPERFLEDGGTENADLGFMAFGGGPRVCIGMRFAMAEMKIALAKLLLKFRLVATEETRLDFFNGDLFFLSYPEVKVKLEKR